MMPSRWFSLWASMVGLLIFVAASSAQVSGIYVEFYDPGNPGDGWSPPPVPQGQPPFPNRQLSQPGLANGTNITIHDAGNFAYRVWAVQPTTATIGNIHITSSGITQPRLLVGSGFSTPGLFPTADQRLPVIGADSVGIITYSGGRPRLQMYVNHCNSVGHRIDFWEIVRIDAIERICSEIRHNPVEAGPNPPPLGRIECIWLDQPGSVTAVQGGIGVIRVAAFISVDITAENGSIGEVSALGNWIYGHIRALNGSIGTVYADTEIGPLHGIGTTPVDIQAKDGIGLVTGGYFSHINLAANANGGTGNLARLEIFGGGLEPGSSVTANNVVGTGLGVPGIFMTGRCFASITLDGSLSRGIQVGNEGLYSTTRIGGGIGADAPITLPANGLRGQIVVNANNQGAAWLSNITVGGVALSPIPDYAQTSAQLGGGAVGYAPYTLHATDCNPAHGASITLNQLPKPVRVRHYGPVTSGGGGSPVTVETRILPGSGPWTDITADFKITLHPANNLRDIAVEQNPSALIGFQAGREYRIRPVAIGAQWDLRCLLVTNSPLVMPYQYVFAITGP